MDYTSLTVTHGLIYLNPSTPVIGCQSCWNTSKTFKIKKEVVGGYMDLWGRDCVGDVVVGYI